MQFILGAVAFFGVFVVEHADVAPHCTTARAEVVVKRQLLVPVAIIGFAGTSS